MSRISLSERIAMELYQIECEDAAETAGNTYTQTCQQSWACIHDVLRDGYRRDARRLMRVISQYKGVRDEDAWRHVCVKAFENLPTDTDLRLADVDAVLLAGARAWYKIELTGDTAERRLRLVETVATRTKVPAADVDAILTWCGADAARLEVTPDV